MTDKERLAKIKAIIAKRDDFAVGEIDYPNYDQCVYELNDNGHIDWLVEQAEHVEDLQIMLKSLAKLTNRYREALEFYAKGRFYKEDAFSYNVELLDGGEKARQALEGKE